jgi:hypothetical protein
VQLKPSALQAGITLITEVMRRGGASLIFEALFSWTSRTVDHCFHLRLISLYVNIAKICPCVSYLSCIFSLVETGRQRETSKTIQLSRRPSMQTTPSHNTHGGIVLKGDSRERARPFLSSGSCELNAPSPTGRMMDDSHMGGVCCGWRPF